MKTLIIICKSLLTGYCLINLVMFIIALCANALEFNNIEDITRTLIFEFMCMIQVICAICDDIY